MRAADRIEHRPVSLRKVIGVAIASGETVGLAWPEPDEIVAMPEPGNATRSGGTAWILSVATHAGGYFRS